MHWPRPGESFWALKCATKGASGGQTSPVCFVDGAVDTSGATHVGIMVLAIAVGIMVLAIAVGVWSHLRARAACRAVSFHLKAGFNTHTAVGTPGLVF